jgi:CBS-domain-containing membrane protein
MHENRVSIEDGFACMKVQNIMTKNVSACSPGTNAAAAAEIMWTNSCGALPVVEDDGRVAGIVTDRDLFIALGTTNRIAADLLVGEVMSRDVATCAPADDVQTALRTMANRKLRRLPVVDSSGKLSGILSTDDVVLNADAGELSDREIVKTMKAICDRQSGRETGPSKASAAKPAGA